jgi:hypothetical protein
MPNDEDFFITFAGRHLKVSPVINGGNIYFIIHFATPIIIAEALVNDTWQWYEADKGATLLAAELGEIIEAMDI